MFNAPFQVGIPQAEAVPWSDERWLTGMAGLDWHKINTSHISLQDYAKALRINVTSKMAGKIRIYLDMMCWISCREVLLGRGSAQDAEFYALLQNLVKRGRVVCPLSMPIIMETYKQSDPPCRTATGHAMDELSTGIAIQSAAGRRQAEFGALISARS